MSQSREVLPPAGPAPESRTPSVLVADPDPVLRQSIAEVLKRAGCRVLALAETAAEARALARKLDPSLVVLGQADTERDVLEMARSVRGSGGAALVLLTPIPNVEWVRAAGSAGVDILLGRPPREADLVAAAELSLARRSEVRRLEGELAGLRERVETTAVVQRAKEALVRSERISDTEAYQRLRRQAERTGRPLRSVAEAVLLADRVSAPT